MPIKDATVFSGKAVFAMVNFLISYVIADVSVIEWCDGEGTISMLPAEAASMRKAVVNPL